ncbi:hypothetical protein IAT38_007280 [Cryptococcus sp. DSM 104549]
MPPPRTESPDVDPFPPLRRSATAASSSPSYASVLASRTARSPAQPLPHRSPSSHHSWSAEDVDRQDNLDELNPNASVFTMPLPQAPTPSHRADPAAGSSSSSSRRRSDRPSSAAGPSRSGPNILTTPRGNGDGPTGGANGLEGATTPVASGSNPPNDRSPPTPSPTRPSRQTQAASPTNREPAGPNPRAGAQVFTLEDMLSDLRRQEEQADATQDDHARGMWSTIRAAMEERRRRREEGDEVVPWRSAAGGGRVVTIGGAGMDLMWGGAGDDGEDAPRVWLPGHDGTYERTNDPNDPATRALDNPVRPLDGSANRTGIIQSNPYTSFLRQNRDGPSNFWTNDDQESSVFDPLSEERDIHTDDEAEWGAHMVQGSNGAQWYISRSGAALTRGQLLDPDSGAARSGVNAGEDDDDARGRTGAVDAYGEDNRVRQPLSLAERLLTLGDTVLPDRGSSLSRGGNNRRRLSNRDTVRPTSLSGTEHTLRPPAARRAESVAPGLEPTNTEAARRSAPLIVRSGGTRRARESDDEWEDCEADGKSSAGAASGTDEEARDSKRQKKALLPHLCTRAGADADEDALPHHPGYLAYSTVPPSTPLPADFVAPLRGSHLTLSKHTSPVYGSAPLITFTGNNPRRMDEDATALLSTIPIPVSCGLHYYEAEVLEKGEEGFMSVGWTTKGTSLRRLVGWGKGSWGWHGDDGRVFEGQGTGEKFSETWTKGDTVGCGVDFTTGQAFFTKNGRMMGHRFSKLGKGVHPAIGLRSVGESLAINFTGPFVFDIDSHVKSRRDGIWHEAKTAEVGQIPRLVDQQPEVLLGAVVGARAGEQETSKDVKGKGKDVAAGASPMPSDLVPLDPIDTTSAAFVLDFLKHNGHSTALNLFHQGMESRKWVAPTSSSALFAEKVEKQPTAEGYDPLKPPRLADFASPSAAMAFLHELVAGSFEKNYPLELYKDLCPAKTPSPHRERFAIYDFLHAATNALAAAPAAPASSPAAGGSDASDEGVDGLFASAIACGQASMQASREEGWGREEVETLKRAFGVLADPEGVDEKVWAPWRKMMADDLLKYIRSARGMKPTSNLETAFAQSKMLFESLATGHAASGAAFIDVRRAIE